jgi:hypothetical protein
MFLIQSRNRKHLYRHIFREALTVHALIVAMQFLGVLCPWMLSTSTELFGNGQKCRKKQLIGKRLCYDIDHAVF